jgi:hypothetical protein
MCRVSPAAGGSKGLNIRFRIARPAICGTASAIRRTSIRREEKRMRDCLSGVGLLATALILLPYTAQADFEGAASTFYGNQTGAHNSSDLNGNTFIGASAGYSNTTGKNNTFLGDTAGIDNIGGSGNTFLGNGAGGLNTTGSNNTFVGFDAGVNNDSGFQNTFIGYNAGNSNAGGLGNTFLGDYAGYSNVSGHHNVFIGNGAGYGETSSQRLYIDNCPGGAPCGSPFIYGEFDNHLLNINGVLNVAANSVSKSQLHFSLANADSGGFLTSVLENNFFMSSGARWDNSVGGWVQRSSDEQSVIQGSGSLGYRVFTSSGHAVASSFTPTTRLLIDYNGLFALNGNATVAGHEIHTGSGAYLTTSGTWTNASSREYKEAIAPLSADAADRTLAALEPVTFRYKNDSDQQRVGFIAEDVPELVAMKGRKGLSPMDIVAVLTKVVQEKSHIIAEQQAELAAVKEELRQLAAEVRSRR